MNPNETCSLEAHHGRELITGSIDSAEILLGEDASELPAQIVGPRVVGTCESVCVPASLGHDLSASVAANIKEGTDFPILISTDDERHAEHGHGFVIVDLGNFRAGGEHEGHALEDLFDLLLPACFVNVMIRWHFDVGWGLLDRSSLGVSQILASSLNQTLSVHE